MDKTCILFRNTFVLFFWEVIKIFAADKQMKNWHACSMDVFTVAETAQHAANRKKTPAN